MNKTEIPAKNLKRNKIKVCIIRITPKTNQHMCRVRSFFKLNMKQIQKAVQALESDRILAAILYFAEKRQKNYRANVIGPICILQIFRKNPRRGV